MYFIAMHEINTWAQHGTMQTHSWGKDWTRIL